MNKEMLGFYSFVAVFLIIVSSISTLFVEKLYKQYQDREFKSFIYKAMDYSKAQLSPAKREVIAEAIIRTSNQMLDTKEQKEQFIALLAVESAFNPDAISKAGAVGLSQIMPSSAKSFTSQCNLSEIQPDKDLKNVDINLLTGACAFKTLVKANNGKVTLAFISYNAGSAAIAVKQLKSGANITNTETASYSVKINNTLDNLRTKK